MWETRELYWGLGRGVEGSEGSKDFLGSRWVRGRGRKVELGKCMVNLQRIGRDRE